MVLEAGEFASVLSWSWLLTGLFLFFLTQVAKHKLGMLQSAQSKGEAARHRPLPLGLPPE